jgi:hypothetical protein
MKLGEIFRNFPSQLFSITDKELISSLEKRKVDILRLDEETWSLISQSIWLQSGDKNTKYFHKFVEHKRLTNTIWVLTDLEGHNLTSRVDLRSVYFKFFRTMYKEADKEDTLTQFRVIKDVPRIFTDEESDEVGK